MDEADRLQDALRACWSVWTADPVDQHAWSPSRPATGQCAVTALIVQERLGGELLLSEVRRRDGSRQGVHYANRLPDGARLDLTAEQFVDGEEIGEPDVVPRAGDVSVGRLAGPYALLASAVARTLDGSGDAPPPGRPVSVKALCLDRDGRVLVGRNWRGELELPGGRPELGERFDRCVEREVAEETGLVVEARRVLGVHPFQPVPGRWVEIVVYGCELRDPGIPVASDEHRWVGFVERGELGELLSGIL